MASRLQDVILRGTAASKPAASATAPGTLYFSTDTRITERSTGSAWESYTDSSAGAIGATVVVRKTADQTVTSSTTLVNDTELLLAIAASEVWQYEFVLHITGNETGDFKVGTTHPTSSAVRVGIQALVNTGSGSSGSIFMQSSATATGGAGFGVNNSATATMVVLKGLVVNSTTPGNIQLQWAQNTSDGTGTVVKANSYLIATRVA